MISPEVELLALAALARDWASCEGCGLPATKTSLLTNGAGGPFFAKCFRVCDSCSSVELTLSQTRTKGWKVESDTELPHAKLARRFTKLLKGE